MVEEGESKMVGGACAQGKKSDCGRGEEEKWARSNGEGGEKTMRETKEVKQAPGLLCE